MAGRIAGITIEIGGDTSNLQKSLKGVDSQLRKTQSNLKDVNKLLKLDLKNTELLTQKYKALQQEIQAGRDFYLGDIGVAPFAVPHDVEGLAELFGGKDKKRKKKNHI